MTLEGGGTQTYDPPVALCDEDVEFTTLDAVTAAQGGG